MRRLSVLALLAMFAIGAAACGSSSNSSSDNPTTTTAAGQASGSSTTEKATPADEVTLTTADSDYGEIVVDQDGRTLYVFTADNGTTSACTGGCASVWPALVAPATAGSGVTGTVGEATQAGGTTQVTLDGHLLYYYGADTSPGATSGQGIGGNWFVVNASGTAIKDAAKTSSPAGGY